MKRFFYTLLISVFLLPLSLFSQDEAISPSIIGTGVYHGLTPPLRDLPVLTEGEFQLMLLEAKVKSWNQDLQFRSYPFASTAQPKGPDPAWQKEMGTTPNPKAPILNFYGQTSPYFPPDANGTVGPNHYMQTINTVYAIYNNTTGALVAGPTNMNLLFSGVTGSGCNDGDPLVLFDEQADRWLAVEFSICGTNDYMLVAVSQTNDPTGSWHKYSFDVADMPDYEKFGIWRDGYYMGTNNSSGNDIYVFERSQMLIGGTAQFVGFNNPYRPNSGFHCVPPVDNDGAFAPTGSPGIFITINDDAWGGSTNDQLWIYELVADWTTPSNSTFNRTETITVVAFDSNFGTSWDNIAQQGTTQELDAIPQVIMQRPQYRNFGTYQTIVCNHAVDVDGTDHSGIRWYELRRTTGTWSVRQYGTYAPDSHSRWMASIALNGSNELGLGYSISSTSMYPGIRYCGQSAATYNTASGLSTMDIAESVIQNGSNSQTSYNRWGDYSNIAIDPDDDHTFWFTSQYGGYRQTKIASFQLSSPSSPPVANFSANNLYPANSMTTVIFTDLSSGNPTSWSWSFSPNTVTYVVGNSSSQNPQVRFNNNGAYTVTLYAQNAYGNDTEVKTDYIHMGQAGLWTGATSTDWNTSTNWDNEEIPISSTAVSITPAAIRWPTKTGNLNIGTDCNSLNISSGITELTVTGDLAISLGKTFYVDPTGLATIIIGGNWTNNGTFTPGNGTVEFNGTNNSVIYPPPGGPAYLINENFSAWPGNWNGDVAGGAGQFGQNASSNAGGTSPEAVFTRGSNITATRRMYHNPVNTTGLTSLTLSFTHNVDFRQTGTIIKVQYSTDGTNWNDAGWSVSPTGNIAATPVSVTLTTLEGIGAANYYIAFVFYGRLNRIDYWYIDDVQLYYSTAGLEIFNNLTISKTNATVSSNGDVDVQQDFTIKPSAYFTNSMGNNFNVFGNATFEADPSGMASFIDNGTSNFSMPPMVQLFLSDGNPGNWHFLSSPIVGAQSGLFTGSYLYSFDEPSDSWVNIVPQTTTLNIMQGYSAWTPNGSPSLVAFNGPLNNGPYTFPVTRNTNATGDHGWNLVGNPFPSSLDWDAAAWTKTNVNNTIYFYSGSGGVNNYKYYVGTGGETPGVGTAGGSNVIPPLQGFFVHVNSGFTSGTLGVSNTQRIHNNHPYYKGGENTIELPLIRIFVEGAGLSDETVIRFYDGASSEFDGDFDAFKLFADYSPQIYSMTPGNTELAINTLPAIEDDLVIPVSFKAPSSDLYSLNFTELIGFGGNRLLYLEDLLLGEIQEITSNPEYEFDYSPLYDDNRFLLHFSNPLGIDDNSTQQVSIYSYEDIIYVQTPGTQKANIIVYDVMGQEVLHKQTINENLIRLKVTSGTGYYLVKVQTGKQFITEKVFIKF